MTVKNTVAIPRRVLIKPKQESRRLNAFVVLFGAAALAAGLGSAFRIQVIGSLPLAEILFLPLMPILLFVQGRQMIRPTMRPLLLLIGIWLVGQIVTDIYRGTAFVDWARSDANIVFFGVDLLVLIALLGRSESRKVIFLVGYSLGHLLSLRFQPQGAEDTWKFGPGPAVNILVLLCSCYFYRRRNYPITLLLLASISAVSLFENCRGFVLFLFITAALTLPIVPEHLGRLRLLPPPGTLGRILALMLLALGAAGAAQGAVMLATASGLLSQYEQEKNEKQAESPGGLLIGARPATLVSWRAVIDSPILGHGSKPKNPKYAEMLADLEVRYGMSEASPEDQADRSEGKIPSHSFLLGTWISAGVLGAVFWIYLLAPASKALLKVPSLSLPLAPLYAYALISLIWNIFFSPFAGVHRVLAALAIVFAAEILETQIPGLANESLRRVRRNRRRPIKWHQAARSSGLPL
jgi:hypothetical protein